MNNSGHLKTFCIVYIDEMSETELDLASMNKRRRYYYKHKEMVSEKASKYYEDHREVLKSRAIAYYHANKERILEQRRMKKVADSSKSI